MVVIGVGIEVWFFGFEASKEPIATFKTLD